MGVGVGLLFASILAGSAEAADEPFSWQNRRDAWSEADERAYEQFVAAIASTDCNTVATCFGAAANPLAHDDPPGLTFSADCADLVYMLRAYFAWKHGLPFAFVNSIEARASGAGDLRHSPGGNRPLGRWDVSADPAHPDIRTVFQVIRDTVSTATFRMDPRIEHPVAQDFYSPAVTREALRPGSAIYNGDGHVVIISKVDDHGRIHFIDAHPDGSVTRGVYAGQFATGDPATGAGFHAWRPIRQTAGRIEPAENAAIPGFSMEQYFGLGETTDWRLADFSDGGRNHDYLEFTRRRLSKGRLGYDIVDETRLALNGLCDAVRERERYVDDAVAAGLPNAPRPGRLGGVTEAEQVAWFAHSTPGRDRRLRKQAMQVEMMIARLVERYRQGDRRVRFHGFSLKRALRGAFDDSAGTCEITYRNTDRDPVTLTLREILLRLPDLSFDPYHCTERRWGADGAELSRCDDDAIKVRWYRAEAALREIDGASVPGNPTLDELEAATMAEAGPTRRIDIMGVVDDAPDRRPRRRR